LNNSPIDQLKTPFQVPKNRFKMLFILPQIEKCHFRL